MRRLISAIGIILFLMCLPVSASAHPGRTDGAGGHTDRSTGEYHYHHGYPAHDHYDMDGDGKDDCPYNFVDKTDASNRDTSNSDNLVPYTNNVNKSPVQSEYSAEELSEDGRSDKKETLFSILFIIGFNILGYFTFWKTEVSWSCLYKLIWIGFVLFSVPLVIGLLIHFLFA